MTSSDSWTEEAWCWNAAASTSEPADTQSKFATPPNDTVARRRSAKFADASRIKRLALAIPARVAHLSHNRSLHIIPLVHSNDPSFMWLGVKHTRQTEERRLLMKAGRGVDLIHCQGFVEQISSTARLLLCRCSSLQHMAVMSCTEPTPGYVLLTYRHVPLVPMADTLPASPKAQCVSCCNGLVSFFCKIHVLRTVLH